MKNRVALSVPTFFWRRKIAKKRVPLPSLTQKNTNNENRKNSFKHQ